MSSAGSSPPLTVTSPSFSANQPRRSDCRRRQRRQRQLARHRQVRDAVDIDADAVGVQRQAGQARAQQVRDAVAVRVRIHRLTRQRKPGRAIDRQRVKLEDGRVVFRRRYSPRPCPSACRSPAAPGSRQSRSAAMPVPAGSAPDRGCLGAVTVEVKRRRPVQPLPRHRRAAVALLYARRLMVSVAPVECPAPGPARRSP